MQTNMYNHMLKLLFLMFFIWTLNYSDEEVVSYDGYKTYRIVAKTKRQLKLLANLDKASPLDFWTKPTKLYKNIDVLVGPDDLNQFIHLMDKYKIPTTVLIENYQEIIEEENHVMMERTEENMTHDKYYRYNDIITYGQRLQNQYPSRIKVEIIGTTTEGRDIVAFIISTGDMKLKNAIFFEGGIHAREWISPATLLYLVHELVENYQENKRLTETVDWFILPVLNPDGYEYSHLTDRLWRKNRAKMPGFCQGVDLNRNFGYKWGHAGSSNESCDEIYRGKEPFSEKESRALRDFANSNKKRIKVYVAMHSYGPLLMYPWGFRKELPEDWRSLDKLARSVRNAIRSSSGTFYEVGSIAQILYDASGGSTDFMKGTLGIAYTYAFELPGGGSEGFNPPSTEIQKIGLETFEGIKVLARFVAHKKRRS